MNVEILRIHEDYVTTIFTLMLLNGLLVIAALNFETARRNIKTTVCFFSKVVLRVCVSLQKFINEIRLRAAIDRFLL